MSFVNLHVHSHYSTLDGLGKVADICAAALNNGSDAVAITDHASLSCLPELMRETEKIGIRPIPGCEFYLVDDVAPNKGEKRIHLSVWAKNWNGVKSILKQLTIANSQFYKKPRLTWQQAMDFKDCIIGTACAIGPLSCDDYEDRIMQLLGTYKEDLYLEIMPHVIEENGADMQELVNKRALELSSSGKYNIPLIATNDSHYVEAADSHTHEILLAIQSGKSWKDPNRWRFSTDGFYIRSEDEMLKAFAALPYMPHAAVLNSIANTQILADNINVVMPKFDVHLPSLYANDDKAFQDKIMAGWKNLIEGKVDKGELPKYMSRLTYEIGVIKKLGFVNYFLIVEDIINWSRANGIMVGPGRGSAAGSLVCYLMGITQVDPLKFNLFFERFLNPERVDLPDIDVDFADNRRDEVFEYIRNKYGHDKTAKINTFTIMGAKSAFRDVCRVFDINIIQVNMLSKQIEDETSFEKVGELVRFGKEHPEIIEQTLKLIGTIRAQGVHAAGIVVSSEPLSGICSIEKRGNVEVVNWDKREVEKFGLLKIDILGLSTLSILNHAKRLIKERHGLDLSFPDISLDDEKTLESFSRGDGIGVFQFESPSMAQLLRDLKARSFSAVTDTTALFRPGSLNSGQTSQYVRIFKGDEYEIYETPELKPILGPTKGIMVYQEQIMMIFNQLGGFTWAEADKMRKIIGKKLGKDEFEKHRRHFVDGCVSNGIFESVASSLFDKMVEFASYSFNKCISGDTILMRCASGKHPSNYTVREAYKIKNDASYARSCGKQPLRNKWGASGGYGYGMSMYEDGRIRKNKIVDIQYAGDRDVYRVDLGGGQYIDVTDNHKFPTPNGKRMLKELKVGEFIYTCGDYEKTSTGGFGFSAASRLDKRGEKGYPVVAKSILSIVKIGVVDTYDVTMEAPNHNFVTSTGIVTCNSHAVSYTMLSFWSMYVKVHYPVEFFAAQLSNSSDERITTLCREAEKYGIIVRLPNINLSTSEYTIDDDGNIIPPLGVIKGVGERAVEEIMLARRETPIGAFLSEQDFIDRVQRRIVNSRVQKLLFRAGCYGCFGQMEKNEETRIKDYSELLPTFNTIPKLAKGGSNIDIAALKSILTTAALCSKTSNRSFMMPVFAKNANKPSIMIINNPVKKEKENLTSEGTKYIMKELKQYGITAKDIYYTSPLKCNMNGATPSRECEGKCFEMLRKEIEAVGPKLIVCFATNLVQMFTGDKKATMSKLHNTVVYNKTFNAYILFSYSPQYCYYKSEDGMMEKIKESIQTLGEIFA